MFANKSFGTLGALVLTVVLAAPGSALAGARIGLLGGGTFPVTSVELEHEREKLDIDLGSGPALGLEGGWEINDSVEVGALVLGSLIDQKTFNDEAATWSATAGARYSFLGPESLVRPFVVGHLGYYGVAVDTDDGWLDVTGLPDKSEGGFGLNGGGGLDIYPVNWFSVGMDVRYHQAFVYDGVGYFTTMLGAAVHFG